MDHLEEQQLEAEALAAIFDTYFEIKSSSPPDETNQWEITLFPIDTLDPDESLEINHVGCKLLINLPANYPEVLPQLDIDIIRGLGPDHKDTLLDIARNEAEQFLGMPAIYSVCEKMREWLGDNNSKGLDDLSMHAQMMRRSREEETKKTQTQKEFESQKIKEELTQAEAEEMAVRKRREEGTPCNKENFLAWKERFEKEMEELKMVDKEDDPGQMQSFGGAGAGAGGGGGDNKSGRKLLSKKRSELEEMENRLTGYQQFCDKLGLLNLDALEKAAEEAECGEYNDENDDDDDDNDDEGDVNVDELDVDEELFDDEEDDLDDLDFDSDDVDDDEDEIDI
mmetsp:Transcript_14080/g.26456  ORF Transcript_14080/g.26456 Transcript_14080/m.26456 type:complete len:339 (-) Transcript_14080:1888-2904(-)|eukprot:CAMPEP_0176500176 /NCGR_PEP_ID=MMETSP0200_2-20121128/13373_1 /TAXON_ID=947934 /ORGANISM="Chaetoceros sp., Strain GSL56" /LENGTH=338 /DNA_ID=CAMNT_0017898749 /DNA_START=25 /DNA_END=1041 /DNA_ORIENTATION=+